jgi:hypothetical protein
LIRKVRPIANDLRLLLELRRPIARVLEQTMRRRRCKVLEVAGVVGRDENRVNERLKRRRFDAMALAAGADDQAAASQRKALRG